MDTHTKLTSTYKLISRLSAYGDYDLRLALNALNQALRSAIDAAEPLSTFEAVSFSDLEPGDHMITISGPGKVIHRDSSGITVQYVEGQHGMNRFPDMKFLVARSEAALKEWSMRWETRGYCG